MLMIFDNIREEELKLKVSEMYFKEFDCTKIIGNIDYCVTIKSKSFLQKEIFEIQSFLWAEAKKKKEDIYTSITQLILTIGKARTFDKHLPPAFLGTLDSEKIALIPYSAISDIFYTNDFNWNVTPSNHNTKEFKQILEKVTNTLEKEYLVFYFFRDDSELKKYIKNNFIQGKRKQTKIKIDKNNFMVIYNKWLTAVKPTIDVKWDIAKKTGIIDGDFYLADLLSKDNENIKEKLYVLLKKEHYELDRKLNDTGLFSNQSTGFTDKQKAHTQFWNKYERPPRKEYWDYIVERRDLLVPQDIRERKGSFFTPQIWVEKSQEYLKEYLGDDWQDEYYVWDCAAGTGNLLAGLTNKFNIYASTVDQPDVDVMHDRIDTMNKNSTKGEGSNLLHKHVFKFDFLNDDFTKLPKKLQDIINDEEKRKKLIIYINPPYAEASDKKTLDGREGKGGVEQSKINKKYASLLGQGNAELFAQFFIRIHQELKNVILAEFSTLKALQGHHFITFRKNFKAKIENMFVVPASSFDNVKGSFPIGFMIWNTSISESFTSTVADVYDEDGNFIAEKNIVAYNEDQYINDWIKPYRADKKDKGVIAKFPFKGNDFQNQNMIAIVHPKMVYNKEAGQFLINSSNLIKASIYYAVRHCIEATWLNDRDQFLFPNKNWEKDIEFQNNCFAYTLFSNNISVKYGTNNWIPFTEKEINAQEKFDSNFMTQFISGKLKNEEKTNIDIFDTSKKRTTPLIFSAESQNVFNAGKELWKYYNKQPNCNVNAGLYDIREYFQGRNATGKMNNKSDDITYMELIIQLRDSLKTLAKTIEPKIYKYGFLKV